MQTSTRPRMDETCRTKLGKTGSFAYAGDQFLLWRNCFRCSVRQVGSVYQIFDFLSWKFDFGSNQRIKVEMIQFFRQRRFPEIKSSFLYFPPAFLRNSWLVLLANIDHFEVLTLAGLVSLVLFFEGTCHIMSRTL